MTKDQLLQLINTFITDLGYDPSEVQSMQLNTQGNIDLSLISKDLSTGRVLNKSERISWQPVTNQLAISQES